MIDIRQSVAQSLITGLASAYVQVGRGWTVYDAPPKALTSPAVIVSPRTPYYVRETYTTKRINLQLTIYIPIGSTLDRIDTILDVILSSLPSDVTWSQADIDGVYEDSGVPYLTASINIEAIG